MAADNAEENRLTESYADQVSYFRSKTKTLSCDTFALFITFSISCCDDRSSAPADKFGELS